MLQTEKQTVLALEIVTKREKGSDRQKDTKTAFVTPTKTFA